MTFTRSGEKVAVKVVAHWADGIGQFICDRNRSDKPNLLQSISQAVTNLAPNSGAPKLTPTDRTPSSATGRRSPSCSLDRLASVSFNLLKPLSYNSTAPRAGFVPSLGFEGLVSKAMDETEIDVQSDPVAAPAAQNKQRRRWRRFAGYALPALAGLVVSWIMAAYVVLPWMWRHYEHQPGLESAPKVSVTSAGIPGDPLNCGFVAAEEILVQAMLGSGWTPADPISWRTSLGIARSVLEKRPYPTAPVSSLFVFGRKQDLAFEKAAGVGGSASQRHHVRFWRSDKLEGNGLPFWLGAATFDRGVGFSHLTGQITHHIAPDIDAERDAVIATVEATGWLTRKYQVTGVGATLLGRNGGGDRYDTDGELTVGVLGSAPDKNHQPLDLLDNPTPVDLKAQLWSAIRPILRSLPDPGPPSD